MIAYNDVKRFQLIFFQCLCSAWCLLLGYRGEQTHHLVVFVPCGVMVDLHRDSVHPKWISLLRASPVVPVLKPPSAIPKTSND